MSEEIISILLIDDDEDDYVITRDFLADSNHRRYVLEWASSYEEGHQAIRRQEHRLYLLDYRLGSHDGLELLKQVVREGYRSPIIILTGRGDDEVDLAAMRAGAADYLVKGEIDPRLLERSIRYAIERKQNEDQIKRQIERLNALREIDIAITGIMDLPMVLDVFLEHLVQQLKIDAADVLLVDPPSGTLRFASARGFQTEALQHTSLPLGEGYAGSVAEDREMLIISDLKRDPGGFEASPHLMKEQFRSYLAVPLITKDRALGVVEVFHRSPLSPDNEWIQFLEMLATQAAIAIDNASLYSQLEEHSAGLERAVEKATLELHQAKNRLEAILNSSPDTIMLLTPEKKTLHVNRAVEALFGYEPDEVEDTELNALLSPEAVAMVDEAIREFAGSTEPSFIKTSTIRKDGSSFDAEIVLAPIRDENETVAIACTIRDVREWVRLQQMQDAFVSNVSHELRTPITSLRLNHDLLKRDPSDPDKYLDRLDREIERLNELIEDLLRLSRLDSGKVELLINPVDLNELIGTIVQDRAPLANASDRNLTFSPSPQDPRVEADSNLLCQAVSVLLTNAINYTPKGGQIEVGVTTQQLKGKDWAGFYVEDDGPGIPPEDLPILFERFYRGKVGRDSGVPGTGLGLSIASEILQRHCGYIDVKSEGAPGEGARFTAWLPLID